MHQCELTIVTNNPASLGVTCLLTRLWSDQAHVWCLWKSTWPPIFQRQSVQILTQKILCFYLFCIIILSSLGVVDLLSTSKPLLTSWSSEIRLEIDARWKNKTLVWNEKTKWLCRGSFTLLCALLLHKCCLLVLQTKKSLKGFVARCPPSCGGPAMMCLLWTIIWRFAVHSKHIMAGPPQDGQTLAHRSPKDPAPVEANIHKTFFEGT